MALTNTYEKQLAKNLFVVDASAATYQIPGATQLYLGLITDTGLNVTNLSTQVALNQETAQVHIDLGGNPTAAAGIDLIDAEPTAGVAGNTTLNASLDVSLQARFGAIQKDSTNTGYYRIPLAAVNIDDAGVVIGTIAPAFTAADIDGSITSAFARSIIDNLNVIKFPTAGPNAWGNIIGWFITDSSALNAAGNIRLMGITNNVVAIAANDRPIFNAGALRFQIGVGI
jgi:hypothetical protein